MPAPSDAARHVLLDSGVPGITHFGLLTALTGTEATGGSYARQAVTWAAASSGTKVPTASVVWTPPASTTVVAWSGHTASSGGTQVYYGGLGSTLRGVGSAIASTNLITSHGHGLAADDRVFVWSALGESALPTGLAATSVYFVLAAGLTSDVFALSATSGGSAVDITANGEVHWAETVPVTTSAAGTDTLTIPAASFVFSGAAL
jgi:hypothetical protein